MQSYNLSELILSPIFQEILEKNKIQFDEIYSDESKLIINKEFLLGENLEIFFKNKNNKTDKKALFILNQIDSNSILPYIKNTFKQYHIISAWSGSSSFGRKISPEINYLNNLEDTDLLFPFDLKGLIDGLNGESNLILLENKEYPENKYEQPNDDEIAFIDQTITDEKEVLKLLDTNNPEILLIGTGNNFEELIKLSQLLETNNRKAILYAIGNWKHIFGKTIQEDLKKIKKIGIIIDHQENEKLINLFSSFGKNIYLITPEYGKIKSYFPEYQKEESDFDANNLYKRIEKIL